MNFAGIYAARLDATLVESATKTGTLIQINSSATAALEILRVWVTFSSTTSTSIGIRLTRRSTAGTGTSFTAVAMRDSAAFGGTVTTVHTAEGTISATLQREFVNYLNGYLYLPVPEERIIVPPSGSFAVDLPVVPASITINAGVIFGRKG